MSPGLIPAYLTLGCACLILLRTDTGDLSWQKINSRKEKKIIDCFSAILYLGVKIQRILFDVFLNFFSSLMLCQLKI